MVELGAPAECSRPCAYFFVAEGGSGLIRDVVDECFGSLKTVIP